MNTKSKLDGRIEEIIELIIAGYTWLSIADKMGTALSNLHKYCSKEEFSARVREALDYSASTYADKAEQVLIESVSDKNEIMRARELAQHYRWKAGKRSPKKYGDKVDLTTAGEKINGVKEIIIERASANKD